MHRLDWPDTGAHLPNLTSFEKEEALATTAAPVPGIYLLWRDGAIVYAGQSGDIKTRLRTHRKEDVKKFHSASFYRLPDEMSRLISEGILILYFLPEYNRGLNLGMAVGRVWTVKWRRPK